MKLVLRGHHLLCLKGFQGYGYDENFVENMASINLKRKCKDTTVSLTNSPDDICKACPNLKNDLCENRFQNNHIIEMDNEVLLKLDNSSEHNSQDLFKKVDLIFNTKESVSNICSNCIWHEECLFYQNLD